MFQELLSVPGKKTVPQTVEKMESALPKPLVIGAPRSGFSLLIAVCGSLLSCLKVNQRRAFRESLIQGMVSLGGTYITDHYYQAFQDLGLMEDVVFNGEFHRMVGGPKWLDPEDPRFVCIRKYIGIKGMGDFLLIVKHPRETLEYYTTLHSHENPALWLNTPYYDSFIKLCSLRNPIGIINSSCFSLNAMASEYLQKFLPSQDENTIRQRHGAYKLTNLEFVRGLIKYLTRYFDDFMKVKDLYAIMKWEDLISTPGPTIQAVARYLGLDISLQTAEQIWKPLDHKNLLLYHKHNYRKGKGIVGDWKNSLVNEHMALFREFGFDNYLKELGYPPIPDLDPDDYSPYQILISRHIQRQEIFSNTGDNDLFNLAFNKTNIDASGFNFKSFEKKQWTHVERTTVENDDIVMHISDKVEQACQKFNDFFIRLNPDTWEESLESPLMLARVAQEMKMLLSECQDERVMDAFVKVFTDLSSKQKRMRDNRFMPFQKKSFT